jgi:hypothetical protein
MEERRRAGCPGPQRVLDVALHPRRDRLAAPVGIEALDVEPQRAGAFPEVRVFEAALVGVGRIGERPERASAAWASASARGWRALSARWRNTTRARSACSR